MKQENSSCTVIATISFLNNIFIKNPTSEYTLCNITSPTQKATWNLVTVQNQDRIAK